MPNAPLRWAALAAFVALAACGPSSDAGGGAAHRAASDSVAGPLTVFAAGSLARPLRAALDTFALRTGITYALESAGSLELARRLTDLGKAADVVALADEEVFPRLLMPAHVTWYARFARNRLVLAHGANARDLEQARADGWRAILANNDVQVGRADPDLDPAGYRTLLLFQLAEKWYREPGLAARLEAAAPRRHMRAKSAELVALLQAGELDYAWMYESSARGARLPFIALPPALDLGEDSLATVYAQARVRVLGARVGDTLEMRGAPIHYGLSIPVAAPHPASAARLVRFLASSEGARILRGEYLDALAAPVVMGEGAPTWLTALATAAPASVARDSARR